MPHENAGMDRRGRLAAGGGVGLLLVLSFGQVQPRVYAHAQQAPAVAALDLPPRSWASEAASTEERILDFDNNAPLRYRVRRVDAKGESVREVVESKQGTVARLVERNGEPLTAEENTAERARLQAILSAPDDFLRHTRRDAGFRSYATELLHSMPQAMVWTYVPGQPQLPGAHGQAVVLDFKPDPNFKPPSLVTEALTGIAGRVWVDVASHCLTRIQGTVLHPVDFGWGGVFAQIKSGGVIQLEQQRASDRRWLYSHIVEHITIREVLVHTAQEDVEMTASDVQPLPAPIGFEEATRMLLAMPVATR